MKPSFKVIGSPNSAQQSYRQKGSEIRGALYRGSTSHAFTKKTIGSIPSKFETVLYPQANIEKKGFGSNSFRFLSCVSENPGPGSYINPTNIENSSFRVTSNSFSKKGFGNGFVSETERFKIDNYHSYQVPGPGSYREPQIIMKIKDVDGNSMEPGAISEKYKNKKSSVFIEHKEKRRKEKKISLLGPGSYQISKDILNPKGNHYKALFAKGGPRFLYGRLLCFSPGPGHYETDMDGIRRALSQTSFNEQGTSSFKLGSGSKRVKVNLYDPFENVEKEEKRGPGPGQYSEDQYDILKRSLSGYHKKSSMFADHEILDRFGNPRKELKMPLKKITPGPGHYHQEKIRMKKGEDADKIKTGAACVFNSDVNRGTCTSKKGPGPAFYKLRSILGKNSKNINPAREWL